MGKVVAALLRAGGAIGPKGDPYKAGYEGVLLLELVPTIQTSQHKYHGFRGARRQTCPIGIWIRTYGPPNRATHLSRCRCPPDRRGRA